MTETQTQTETLTCISLDTIYQQEIEGDYAQARDSFRELNGAITAFDPARKDHVATRLYHADMLTVDGQFAEASRLLRDTYRAVGKGTPELWATLARHRGHAHRFSFDFEEAENLYRAALDAADKSPTGRAELLTNIAEVACWTDPAEGVGFARDARDANLLLDNDIEQGKSWAAMAVAYSGVGEFAYARGAAEHAFDYAEEANYPAGRCFALQALVVVEHRAGNAVGALRAYQRLVEEVESLGTYGHLAVLPAHLLGDTEAVNRWSAGVEWVGYGDIRNRIDQVTAR